MSETPAEYGPRFQTFEVGGWRVTYGVGLSKPHADVIWASETPPSAMLGKWAMLHLTAASATSLADALQTIVADLRELESHPERQREIPPPSFLTDDPE
jgi:hypothetical protein